MVVKVKTYPLDHVELPDLRKFSLLKLVSDYATQIYPVEQYSYGNDIAKLQKI